MSGYQLSLFPESGDSGSSMRLHVGGLTPAIKSSMQRSLAAVTPPMSRDHLVDRMNAIAKQHGVRLTIGKAKVLSLAVLEKWLSPTDKEHIPPLEAFVIFMLAVGDFSPLVAFADFCGCQLITEDEIFFLEYGKAKFEAKEKAKEMKRLEDDISNRRRKGGR